MVDKVSLVILFSGGALALPLLGFPLVRALRKRERPRFSIAWLLAFVVALSIALYGGVKWWTFDPEEAEWQARLERTLSQKVPSDWANRSFKKVRWEELKEYDVSVIVGPPLYELETPFLVDPADQSLKTSINKTCSSAGLHWVALNEAIYIYDNSEPTLQPLPHASTSWEKEIIQRLKLEVSWIPDSAESLGFLTEALLNHSSGVDFSLSPDFKDSVYKCYHFKTPRMHIYNILSWLCYLADAEWSLKPTPDGKGMVWIEPRKKK